jgi:hypothetical protein
VRFLDLAKAVALAGACAACSGPGGDPPAPPSITYLSGAHAHNDYVRERPLLDAVARGFASVEVDVVLRDGELYVAHDADAIRPDDTLTRLYLEPLRGLVGRNGGHVYASSDPVLQLLIDVKSEPDETYRALDAQLSAFPDLFTNWTGGDVHRGPVTAVLSGNRAIDLLVADTARYVALDGRLDDQRGRFDPDLMPMVSIDWGVLDDLDSAARLTRAREWVDLVHGEGRTVRFWGTPDREQDWAALLSMGVDHIGADDIGRLERALRAR